MKRLLWLWIFTAVFAHAGEPPRKDASPSAISLRSPEPGPEAMRVEGERRFRANCGRCHQPPHKFPPRMIATIERHMRVRALVTDEDMRLILRYLTQ